MNVQAEIAPPGSSLYYSLLGSDANLRQKIIALRGFYQTIREIPFKVQNTQLAEIKFQWWREELERLKSKTAQHPITKILQDDFQHHAELETILNAFSDDAKISLYEKDGDLNQFYYHTTGLLEKVLAEIQNIHDDSIEDMGVFIQKVLDLRDLRKAITRGKIYLSGELLLQHRVTLYELSQFKLTENILALFKNHADNIREKLNFSLSYPKNSLILAKIHCALLNEIERAGFPVLTQSISLTPFRKWWIAWKT